MHRARIWPSGISDINVKTPVVKGGQNTKAHESSIRKAVEYSPELFWFVSAGFMILDLFY